LKAKSRSVKDTYRTIESPSQETLFKEKGSKFFGYAFPISKEEEVKLFLEQLKLKHPTAGHFCYAWQLGEETIRFRVNDDGEPNNSAGQPIYGQLQSFDMTNILVVSVRYFGGTKLGVGGLIQAYKYSAQLTLESVAVVERTIDVSYQLIFDYPLMNKVMRIVKEKNIHILEQDLGINCVYRIAVRKSEAEEVIARFESLYELELKKLT
jgi:uncharacterized YigZ family protein